MFTEYKVVAAEKNTELTEKVEALLDEGWKLHGAPFVAVGEDYWFIYQAMTKENANED